jgi:hypothetical protein
VDGRSPNPFPFTMANYPDCPICKKGFTQYVPKIFCTTCLQDIHISCLPAYSDADILAINNSTNIWSCTICLFNLFPFYNIEDNDDIINQMHSNSNSIHLNVNELLYDPFDSNQDGGALEDLDPDDGYYNLQNIFNSDTCKYYYPEQLEQNINNWTIKPNVSFLHQNIRSLRQNYTKFITLLDSLDHSFSVLGLTETWLKPYNASLFNIDGYNHKFITRENKAGGGVSMFINVNLPYIVRSDLTYQDDDCEMIWIEVDKVNINSDKNYVIGTIYRRPG